ncbi:MAG: hypothetical protein Q7U91_04420 [Sideroxyarcus sp.]|nr:hypothetical protein [Sideroxyarcus sp.]
MKNAFRRLYCCLAVALVLLSGGNALARTEEPARAPLRECKWEKVENEAVGLAAWVQECDFGFRKLEFVFRESSLAVQYSDSKKPNPVVDVIDLLPYETLETGLRRIFFSRTDRVIARRCVLKESPGAKPGAKRYVFQPNAEYRKELRATAAPGEIGEPPCGEWGEGPDGVQYFEAWPQGAVRKVLFVRLGQDVPLFDEQSLHLISPDDKASN